MNDKRPWIGFNEAAELCGVCVQTIRNHEKKGSFRSRWFSQLGLHGGRLIERKSLLEWREDRRARRQPADMEVIVPLVPGETFSATVHGYLLRIDAWLELIHEWQKGENPRQLEEKGGL